MRGLCLAALPLSVFAAVLPTPQPNSEGVATTFSTSGGIDTANAFFKPMGNGRSCASCHSEAEGWTLSPAALNRRFAATNGSDPVFRPADGANSPLAPTATLDQKRIAYSMLLTKGLIRVGMPIPPSAEFTLLKADDPYHYARAEELSLFRHPLPTTNLKFASGVMWDGRETQGASTGDCVINSRPPQCFATLDTDLLHQANSAVRGHAEAARDLTASEQRAIVDFEKSLFTTQTVSNVAGPLPGAAAQLAQGAAYFGINDVNDGDYVTRAPFNRNAMTLFGALRNPGQSPQDRARNAIARGEQLFNNRPFNIVGVAGFNDELRVTLQRGTCTSCHSTPNAGSHSLPRLFNTGVSAANLRTPDLPLYTLKNKATGEIVETSDPPAALATGKRKDIGKFKVPGLRGLTSRAPFFHDGSAANVDDVVRFYDRRFRMGLNPQEAADLASFLKAL